jgi:hypothetical protein
MVMLFAVSTRSLRLTRNHIHFSWLAKGAALSPPPHGREDAGTKRRAGRSREIKHLVKPSV